MKKILLVTLLSVCSFAVFSTPTYAATNMCNQRCDVDTDCGSGYRCYVGVCRLDICPASSSCSCGSAVSATPTSTPKPVTPTATPKPTLAPKPTVTPKVTASGSGNLTHSPKTGVSTWTMAFAALALFAVGSIVARFE